MLFCSFKPINIINPSVNQSVILAAIMLILGSRKIARSQGKLARDGSGLDKGEVAKAT